MRVFSPFSHFDPFELANCRCRQDASRGLPKKESYRGENDSSGTHHDHVGS
jgi:hypothetical protein